MRILYWICWYQNFPVLFPFFLKKFSQNSIGGGSEQGVGGWGVTWGLQRSDVTTVGCGTVILYSTRLFFVFENENHFWISRSIFWKTINLVHELMLMLMLMITFKTRLSWHIFQARQVQKENRTRLNHPLALPQ